MTKNPKICLHHYKKTNNLILRLIRKIKKEPIWINNVYSTYPILLKKTKKEKVYSNIVTILEINQLKEENKFLKEENQKLSGSTSFWSKNDNLR